MPRNRKLKVSSHAKLVPELGGQSSTRVPPVLIVFAAGRCAESKRCKFYQNELSNILGLLTNTFFLPAAALGLAALAVPCELLGLPGHSRGALGGEQCDGAGAAGLSGALRPGCVFFFFLVSVVFVLFYF